jgi:hypothetical protein
VPSISGCLAIAFLAVAACAPHPPIDRTVAPRDLRAVCNEPSPGPNTRPYTKRGVVFLVPDIIAQTDSLAPTWWNDEWLARAPVAHWLEVDVGTARLARAKFEQVLPDIGSYHQAQPPDTSFGPAEQNLVRCPSVAGGPDFLMIAYTRSPNASTGWYNLYAAWPVDIRTAPGFLGGSDTERGARALLAAFRHQDPSRSPLDSVGSLRPPQN